MNRLVKCLQQNKKMLSLFAMAGYPQRDSLLEIVPALENASVDFLEIGMPYSDPLADGATIQAIGAHALEKSKIDLDIILKQVKEIRAKSNIPMIAMGYFNQVLQYGFDDFCKKAAEAGIDGFILPDLPPEYYENSSYQVAMETYDLGMNFLITPETSEERIDLIDQLSQAFIYVVPHAIITGQQAKFGDSAVSFLKRIADRKLAKPLMAGFGIATSEDFQTVTKFCKGAIIGSAYLKALREGEEAESSKEFVQGVLG